MLVFWEGAILMIKEGASPFGSVLGSLFLEFHSQLSSLGRGGVFCSLNWGGLHI